MRGFIGPRLSKIKEINQRNLVDGEMPEQPSVVCAVLRIMRRRGIGAQHPAMAMTAFRETGRRIIGGGVFHAGMGPKGPFNMRYMLE